MIHEWSIETRQRIDDFKIFEGLIMTTEAVPKHNEVENYISDD